MDIATLLQWKLKYSENCICTIYTLFKRYLNEENKCTCSKIAVQFANGTVETDDVDAESVLIKQVEEALKKAHLALYPKKAELEPVAVVRPCNNVPKIHHKKIYLKKSKSDSSEAMKKQRKYIPAHLKAPYKTDVRVPKRKLFSLGQPLTSFLPMKEMKDLSKETVKNDNKTANRQEDHAEVNFSEDMNSLCHLARMCECSQRRTHQQAVLAEQIDKSVSDLWRLISCIRKVSNSDDKSILPFFSKNISTESKLVSGLYFAIQKCNLAIALFNKFTSLIQFIDVQKVGPNEICWIQQVFSKFTRISNLLGLLLIKVNSGSSDLSSEDVLYDPLTYNDPISTWFASKRSVKSDASPSPFEAFLTIGNFPITPGAFSRVSALTACPQMCVFSGSEKQALLFTNLWSELESMQTELELLKVFKANLPDLLADHLFTKPMNRASAFRNLYTLICGNSPTILKSNV
ncbi:unnamed protein product [Schistosoma turkestanicum]|nr:unnamed protein product [Schistosoma turkestanicum]